MSEANPERLEWTGGAPGDDLPARWLAAIEQAAGLPAGSIVGRLVRRLAEEWAGAGPGGSARWLDEQFPFEGSAEEKAQCVQAIYRLECRWRAEIEAQESRAVGWQ